MRFGLFLAFLAVMGYFYCFGRTGLVCELCLTVTVLEVYWNCLGSACLTARLGHLGEGARQAAGRRGT